MSSPQADAANVFAMRLLAQHLPEAKQIVELPGRNGRDLAQFAKELGAVMSVAPLFRREDVVVTVEPNGEVKVMTPDRFITWATDYAQICDVVEVGRPPHRQEQKVKRTMPLSVAKGCLQADHFTAQLRPLTRVNGVRMPVLRADRVELLPEGYDIETGFYTLPSVVAIREDMSLEEAKAVFDDYYRDFRFTDERSRAVAITMALALYGIGMQPIEAARMGFMVRANTQGGGKSLVAQLAITPTFGLPENTARAQDDELRKILDSAALQGVPYLFFDNLKNHFENALVEGFMTTPVWRARVMGSQRFMRGKVCCVLIITGNNLTVSPDLQRRLLQCDLFIEEFNLQEKTHRRELNPVVINQPEVRAEFLGALWALIRHWDGIGRPPAGPPGKPHRIATFATWSDIFGGIIQAAGYGNPLVAPKDDQIASRITVHQRQLVELLARDLTAKKPVLESTFQDMADIIANHGLFDWKLKGRWRDSEEDGRWFEATPECASALGLMLTNEMGGRLFSLPDGRRVRFSKTGEGRAKRYVVELLDTERQPCAA